MSRTLEPAGSRPAKRPFEELPFELAEVADRVLEDGKSEFVSWPGEGGEQMELVFVADEYLQYTELANNMARPGGLMTKERAWKVVRADGRTCYIFWRGDGEAPGAFGTGKPRWG